MRLSVLVILVVAGSQGIQGVQGAASPNCSYSASDDSVQCSVSQLHSVQTVTSHTQGLLSIYQRNISENCLLNAPVI